MKDKEKNKNRKNSEERQTKDPQAKTRMVKDSSITAKKEQTKRKKFK